MKKGLILRLRLPLPGTRKDSKWARAAGERLSELRTWTSDSQRLGELLPRVSD